MSTDRVRYQRGTVEFHAKARKYYFRYRDADRRRRSVLLGTADELSTAAKLKRATDQMRAKVNAEQASSDTGMLMNELIENYRADRMPARQSTARGYNSKLNNHIIPRWGNVPVAKMIESAYEVDQWLKTFDGSPKSKVHLRGLLSILIEYAMLTRVVPVGRNPMELVRIENASRRKKEPRVLSFDEFVKLLAELREPYRTMALIAAALGLRCSEFEGLKWQDVDADNLTLTLRQAVVNGKEDEMKTLASKAILPIDQDLLGVLDRWRSQTTFKAPEDWVFASPFTLGRKPYHGWSAQNQVLSPAGVRAGIGPVGWHDLRHSYRTWLDQAGAPVGVQKDLMRHASITTTMDIYGRAIPTEQRKAHGNVVGMLKNAVGAL
jgi:integrase